MPHLTFCPGLQCLRFCGGSFLSHTKKLDVGGALGGGRCGVCVQRRSSWFMCFNSRAFNSLRACLPSHMDMPSAAKACSPCFMQEFFIWVGQLQDFKMGISSASYRGSTFARHNAVRTG